MESSGIRFQDNKEELIRSNEDESEVIVDGEVTLINHLQSTARLQYQVLHGHLSDVTDVDFHGSSLLVSSSNDKTVRIWKKVNGAFNEITEGSVPSPLKAHSYSVNCVRFSPLGCCLNIATCSTDGYAIVWDLHTGQQIVKFCHPSKCAVRICCFSPSAESLVTAGDDESICIWDLRSQTLLRCLEGHDSMVTTCAFTPDSLHVLSGSTTGDLKLWDARYGHAKWLAVVHEAHDLGVLGSDFSSKFFVNEFQTHYVCATCGSDDLVKVWRIQVGLMTRIDLLHSLAGHSGNVNCVKFSHGGLLLASAAGDKSTIIWNAKNGERLCRLEAHNRYATCCAFAADNSLLATGSNDKTVIIWDLSSTNTQESLHQMGSIDDVGSHILSLEPRVNRLGSIASGTQNVINDWSVDEVSKWLKSIKMDQYVQIFKENDIDGTELLHLSHDSLLTSLKIEPLGHRNKILRRIQGLKNPSWQQSMSTDENGSIPDELYCPITHELMKEPVVASDGYSYEMTAIKLWFNRGSKTSPMTNEPLKNRHLIQNTTLKLLIRKYMSSPN